MQISQLALAYLSFIGFCLGFLLGIAYDFFAIGEVSTDRYVHRLPLLNDRKVKPPRFQKISTFCKDVIFCLFAGICIILLFYEYNNGKIRITAIVTMLCGALMYSAIVRRITKPLLKKCRFWFTAGIRYAIFFMLWPIRAISRMLWYILKKMYQKQKEAHYKRARIRETAKAFSLMEQNNGDLFQITPKAKKNRGQKHAGGKKETI